MIFNFKRWITSKHVTTIHTVLVLVPALVHRNALRLTPLGVPACLCIKTSGSSTCLCGYLYVHTDNHSGFSASMHSHLMPFQPSSTYELHSKCCTTSVLPANWVWAWGRIFMDENRVVLGILVAVGVVS